MAKTVIGLIESNDEARKAVEELLAAGFDKRDIGAIVPDEFARETVATVAGASTGMLVGGLAGMLLAAAAFTIPGLGPVVVAGPGLMLIGTALGAVAGGLIGGLVNRGVPEEDAKVLAEGVKRGGTLITVNARTDDRATKAVEIMKRHGAVDLDQRAAEWRKLGWTGRPSDAATAPAPAPAQMAASGTPDTAQQSATSSPSTPRLTPAPGIATVVVYDFEIVEPVVAKPYSGPERRVKNIPHEPERRMAA